MIRGFIIALSLLGVSVSVATATETPTPEPSPTFGTGLYCIPVGQPADDNCGWEFEEGRYVDPRWINACAPECAGVNQRVQNQDRCEWKLLYDGATATPMFFNPTATPTITPTPTPSSSTNCGQSLPIHNWVNTGYCTPTRNLDGTWESCVHQVAGNRWAQLRVSYTFESMQDVTNLTFNYSGNVWVAAIGFDYCAVQQSGCHSSNVRHIWYNSNDDPDLSTRGLSQERVFRITILLESEPCGVYVCSAESLQRILKLSNVRFCATGFQFPPEVTPTPSTTPTITPTPTPETTCTNTGKGIHMDGVASADCQLNYPSPWDEFANEFYNNPSDGNCQGAYYFGGVLPPLYDDEYDTIWFGGATYSALCSQGIVYTFYLNEESYYQRVCQTQGWETITHIGSKPAPKIDNPEFRIGISKLDDPNATVWGAIDNFWVSYYDKPLCLDSGIQCHEPMYTDEIPPLFSGLNMTRTKEWCRILLHDLSENAESMIDLEFDGLTVCFDLYDFDPIIFFGIEINIVEFFRIMIVVFLIKYIFTR